MVEAHPCLAHTLDGYSVGAGEEGMKFCVLASSSKGNSIYVSSGSTQILIDVGLSCKMISERLSEIGVDLKAVDAICVTHEHVDHMRGLPVIVSRYGMSLYATEGTSSTVEYKSGKKFEWNIFQPGSPFEIGDLHVDSFSISHDAADPVGFVISDGISRLGIVTDLGEESDLILRQLSGCHGLILEFNHDPELLRNADRSWESKQRTLGRSGHLSNDQASDLLRQVAGEQLRAVFLAHLSEDCNTPLIATQIAESALADCGLSGLTQVCVPHWPSSMLEV